MSGIPTRTKRWASLLAMIILVSACAAVDTPGLRTEPMSADQLAQNDINRMLTLAMRDNQDALRQLLEKLYRRNPSEWRKAGFPDLQAALAQGNALITQGAVPPSLVGLRDIEVLSVALDPQYPGDRVAAFVLGLSSMLVAAHDGRTRFYLGDSIEAQHVFNAARNVEIAAWLLATRRNDEGHLLLLSNEMSEGHVNLSFERELAGIIARLDLEAEMLDENLRRIGINYVQGLLFFKFLPVR